MSDIKIFVSHRIDMDSELVDNPLFVPIRCGAVLDNRNDVTMLGDDTGKNISEKRMTFNEFTVLYWAWKNVSADYYGLCHYRRYMVFSPNELQADPYGNVLFDQLDYDSSMECGLLDSHHMSQVIEGTDIITSVPYDVTYRGFHNLFEHYAEVPTQHRKDLELALAVVKELHPKYSKAAEEYLNGTKFYPCNLFIMRKDIFEEYCQWLFSILFELEKRIDITGYDETEQRAIGFLGERLWGVFFTQHLKEHPNCKWFTLQRALFWHTEYNGDCRQSLSRRMKYFVKRHVRESSMAYRVLKEIYHVFEKEGKR